MKRWLAGAVVLLLGRGRRRPLLRGRDRIVQPGFPNRRVELAVAFCFLAAAACGAAFPVIYAVDAIPRQTQFLGLAIGLAFLFAAAACIAMSRLVEEEEEHDYPPPAHPEQQERVEQIVEEGGDRFTRKRLLVVAGGAAGTALGVALLTPAASLGPVFDVDPLYRTPWRRGLRLVDEAGRPFRVDAVEEDTFYTAYPERADREQVGAPLIVVRLEQDRLRLPEDRRGWAPKGIVAYSKICTHAGCAVAIYRKPTFPAVEPRPALICPCHFSTFDPAEAGKVLFGPAGRALPQLPLAVDARGELRAAGNFSGPVGPSWWGVRNRGAKP